MVGMYFILIQFFRKIHSQKKQRKKLRAQNAKTQKNQAKP